MTGAEVCILDLERDRATWNGFTSRLPSSRRDVHYTPEYLDIYRYTYGANCSAIYYRNGHLEILQPIVKNAIAELPFVDEEATCFEHEDIESPYGFGGPLANYDITSQEARDFYIAKKQLLNQSGGVSEFCSFHPLFKETEYQSFLVNSGVDLQQRKPCAYIDLQLPFITLWSGIEERQRKAIASARKREVVIKKSPMTDESIENFYRDYIATMERVNAGADWFFPSSYFRNCLSCLGEASCSIFSACVNDETIASFFLVHRFSTCYYHFSCSNPKYASYNANHLLLFDTMLWAKSQGFDQYFLGGGFSADGRDSLYKFKQSFSRSTCWLTQSKDILNPQMYADIDNRKREYDKLSTQRSMSVTENVKAAGQQYFPSYRS